MSATPITSCSSTYLLLSPCKRYNCNSTYAASNCRSSITSRHVCVPFLFTILCCAVRDWCENGHCAREWRASIGTRERDRKQKLTIFQPISNYNWLILSTTTSDRRRHTHTHTLTWTGTKNSVCSATIKTQNLHNHARAAQFNCFDLCENVKRSNGWRHKCQIGPIGWLCAYGQSCDHTHHVITIRWWYECVCVCAWK